MPRNIRFRPSPAEQRRRVQDALNLYAPSPVDIGAKAKREPPKTFRLTPEAPYERDVLKAVVAYLRAHPAVAWVQRINSGAATDERGQFMRFHTIAGCSDLIGQLKSGHFLACEVKRPGEKPTEPQMLFLRMVEHYGGCAGWADSVDAAERMMRDWTAREG